MAKMLKDTLKTIEVYKTQNPHYEELLAILEEILILREEYRRKLTADVFPVDERLITSKIEGGLPLIDLSQGDYDLTQPREYFFDLLRIAEKRAPGETRELARKIKEGEEDFRELVLSAFYGDETAAVEDAEGEDADDTFDLIDLFLEECLRPAFERVAAKYGDVVLKSKWKEGYCPICGKEPKN